jgi:Tfp pilus assembly protein PilO
MNLDRLTEFLAKIPGNFILVAFLAYLGYSGYQFKYSPTSDLHLKENDVLTAKGDITRLKQKVKEVNDFLNSLSAKKQQLRQIAQDLENTRATLPSNVDSSAVVSAILTEAKRAGIRVNDYSPPTGSKLNEFYAEQEFTVRSSGVFFQYLIFLDRLASLQQILRVSGADFNLASGVSAESSYVRLNCEFKIKAYSYIESPADKIGKNSLTAEKPQTGCAFG